MHTSILIVLFAVAFSILANAEEPAVDKGAVSKAQNPGKSVKKTGKMGILKNLAESGMLKNMKKTK